MSSSFDMAMKISAPLIVVGIILYFTAGILARLVPNLQVFFLLMAPQIMLALFVLMTTISAVMLWYMHYADETITQFMSPG